MNPYEFKAGDTEDALVERKSTVKTASVYLLVGSGSLSVMLCIASSTLKENGWLLGATFLALLVTAFISAVQYFVSLVPALSLGRWQPPLCGLLTAALVVTFASQFQAPPSLKVVLLPLFIASLVSTSVMHERDWESVLAYPPFKPHPVQRILISVFAVIGLAGCVLTGIGKPLLIALGQDEVRVMQSEKVK